MLWTIGEAHHLDEPRIRKVLKIVTYVMMGFVHPNDLQKEISGEIGVDKRLAGEIAHEVQLKILNPLMPEINAAFNYHITGVPAQPTTIRPAFVPPSGGDQPFILHEEQMGPLAGGERSRPREEELMRPSFYESEARSINHEAGIERTEARLEIGPSVDSTGSPQAGSGQVEKKEPRVGKTEEPPVRVVHYTGPQTPVDPFAPQQETGNRKQETELQKEELPKDIHPENIVDLKDLPR